MGIEYATDIINQGNMGSRSEFHLPEEDLAERENHRYREYDMREDPMVKPMGKIKRADHLLAIIGGGSLANIAEDDVVRGVTTGTAYRISRAKGPKIITDKQALDLAQGDDGTETERKEKRFGVALRAFKKAFEERFSASLRTIFTREKESIGSILRQVIDNGTPLAVIVPAHVGVGCFPEGGNLFPEQASTAEKRAAFTESLRYDLSLYAEEQIRRSGLLDSRIEIPSSHRGQRPITADKLNVRTEWGDGENALVVTLNRSI